MRFAIAVLVSAAAQLLIYLRSAGVTEPAPLLTVSYLMLASLGAGWFAARRAALAGALSIVLGALLYAIVVYVGPAGIGLSPADLVLAVGSLVVAFWPYVVLGAVAGEVGGSLRRRLVR